MKALVIIFAIIFTSNAAIAQDTVALRYKKSYWMDIGGGWGGEGGGPSIGFSYEHKRNRFISFRYSTMYTNCRCADYAFIIPVSDNPLGHDVDSYEFNYGFLSKKSWGMLNFSVGLAYKTINEGTGEGDPAPSFFPLAGSTCPANYKTEKTGNAGLVLRGEIMPSLKWGGISLAPSLHLGKYTYAMFTVNMTFGRIRPKNLK